MPHTPKLPRDRGDPAPLRTRFTIQVLGSESLGLSNDVAFALVRQRRDSIERTVRETRRGELRLEMTVHVPPNGSGAALTFEFVAKWRVREDDDRARLAEWFHERIERLPHDFDLASSSAPGWIGAWCGDDYVLSALPRPVVQQLELPLPSADWESGKAPTPTDLPMTLSALGVSERRTSGDLEDLGFEPRDDEERAAVVFAGFVWECLDRDPRGIRKKSVVLAVLMAVVPHVRQRLMEARDRNGGVAHYPSRVNQYIHGSIGVERLLANLERRVLEGSPIPVQMGEAFLSRLERWLRDGRVGEPPQRADRPADA